MVCANSMQYPCEMNFTFQDLAALTAILLSARGDATLTGDFL
jgi:hypothetical protein